MTALPRPPILAGAARAGRGTAGTLWTGEAGMIAIETPVLPCPPTHGLPQPQPTTRLSAGTGRGSAPNVVLRRRWPTLDLPLPPPTTSARARCATASGPTAAEMVASTDVAMTTTVAAIDAEGADLAAETTGVHRPWCRTRASRLRCRATRITSLPRSGTRGTARGTSRRAVEGSDSRTAGLGRKVAAASIGRTAGTTAASAAAAATTIAEGAAAGSATAAAARWKSPPVPDGSRTTPRPQATSPRSARAAARWPASSRPRSLARSRCSRPWRRRSPCLGRTRRPPERGWRRRSGRRRRRRPQRERPPRRPRRRRPRRRRRPPNGRPRRPPSSRSCSTTSRVGQRSARTCSSGAPTRDPSCPRSRSSSSTSSPQSRRRAPTRSAPGPSPRTTAPRSCPSWRTTPRRRCRCCGRCRSTATP
mmetsp:Transcript_24092/g.51591  ORF Transcript_24092/g.51591 Transcript_24092/m.51591 type:complete len:420 (-) Transcript_24092:371-1630(-)